MSQNYYSSEQIYKWLESRKTSAYVKHNQFARNQNKNIRKKRDLP